MTQAPAAIFKIPTKSPQPARKAARPARRQTHRFSAAAWNIQHDRWRARGTHDFRVPLAVPAARWSAKTARRRRFEVAMRDRSRAGSPGCAGPVAPTERRSVG